jgi:L-fuculokinase
LSDQGGPFAGRKGRIEGEAPASPEARAALATLYAGLMTAHLLHRLDAPGELIVEGGFTRTPAFAAVLAGLMPDRRVVVAPTSAGAAAGAALLAHWGAPHEPPRLEPARAWTIPGLQAYRDKWERSLSPRVDPDPVTERQN